MCGIWGAWLGQAAMEFPSDYLAQTLSHRGPDDAQFWSESDGSIWLGHNRLAILDLSNAGQQPMHSSCGRYVIVFNGEVYNHLVIRAQLESDGLAPAWRGHSDTESLIEAVSAWGLERTLTALAGMFAFALWDSAEKTLTLVRDRLGEKPLYFGWAGSGFAFASELKALRAIPGFKSEIDKGSLALYMRYGYVPTPYSIYKGVSKLPPGCLLVCGSCHIESLTLPKYKPYWNAIQAAKTSVSDRFTFNSDAEAVDSLESVLRNSIRDQMIADVPLGAFLSGGIDSSVVVALMQDLAKTTGNPPVKTFSIGFNERAYDEAPHARAVASHLGTEHKELYVSPAEALAVIPRLPHLYDEPFADSSQVPTYLVCEMTKQHVTVALSGDGGDELFGGYNRYFLAARMWNRISRMPQPARDLAGRILRAIPIITWDALYRLLMPVIPKQYQMRLPGEKIHKAGRLLGAVDEQALYRGLVSQWDPFDVVLDAVEPNSLSTNNMTGIPTLIEKMMLYDSVTYLPDDILTKVDRAAMAVSLETRIPLLDHRVYEFAWRLPLKYKVRDGSGKWILKELLYKYVPQSLVDRPKMGFGVPIDVWLRGPLRDWAEMLLDESRLVSEGYFNAQSIRLKWQDHLSGKYNWQHQLWPVLMFQAWLMEQ
ncbi:asparagine synthase (glutamine-hydrolyzing) [Sedimenticola selenatireducens]|uniref:asparagine synthase (glutamine-hydrolyzing) n=1 Tax=Sedimenticola selenatireducens TaxID=191960 RepID=A0A557S4V6_9GAMM|nr:asparagine synthase (glutamine-hydrolyzing) [Sedimenticola selenatireducens]TVO72438.1 asparagine synthase (glutamine-hydrolyzing) [Sedimenticola selenatireducens]TVT64693.1 MAG: asparagine synthase (glutamine-hydrolyzing) [Sedimenticola selenatireducens]